MSELSTLYNRGKRSFTVRKSLEKDAEILTLRANRTVDVEKEVAKKMVKLYPKELFLTKDSGASSLAKKAIVEKDKEIAELKKQLAEAKAGKAEKGK